MTIHVNSTLEEDYRMKRFFWSLFAGISGLLIGISLNQIININSYDYILLLIIGVAIMSFGIWGYRKYVGKGLLFKSK